MTSVKVDLDYVPAGQMVEVGFLGVYPNGETTVVPEENLITFFYHGGVVPDDDIIKVPGELRPVDLGPAQPGQLTSNQIAEFEAALGENVEMNLTSKEEREVSEIAAHEPAPDSPAAETVEDQPYTPAEQEEE